MTANGRLSLAMLPACLEVVSALELIIAHRTQQLVAVTYCQRSPAPRRHRYALAS